jgi:hypothetical protein
MKQLQVRWNSSATPSNNNSGSKGEGKGNGKDVLRVIRTNTDDPFFNLAFGMLSSHYPSSSSSASSSTPVAV